jgi:DNA repair exonuclease SbcCD nuclease subunit
MFKEIKLDSDKVNLVYSTDQHLSAIPPGRRRDNYAEAVLEKLQLQGEVCHKLSGAGLSGGDMFHHKNPDAKGNTHSLIESTIRVLSKFPTGKIYGCVGNHDIQYDRMETLPNQPLGVLIAAGVYHNIVEESVVFTNRDGSIRVLVDSYPFLDERVLFPRLMSTPKKPLGITHRVGLLHAYGHPDPANAVFGTSGINYNPIGYDALIELDYDFLCWGHDHTRKETVTVGNITHINFGSLARAAFSIDEIDRPVCIGIMSFSENEVKYKEKQIQVTPLEAAFATADRAVDRVVKSDEITDFFSSMETTVGSIESTDPREVITELCKEEPKLLEMVFELCEL